MKRKRPRRLRILYVLLAILIAISVLPLWFYGRTMSQANQQTLKTQEQILQTTIAQSLGQEVSLYMANLRQNLSELFDTVLPLASQIDAASFSTDPRLRSALENFITGPHNVSIPYVTAVNNEAQGRGAQAPDYNVADDAFVRKSLESAFIAARQGHEYQSDPPITVVTQKGRELVMVISRPINVKGRFRGMVAAVVTLKHIVKQLKDTAEYTGLEAYIVDNAGRLIASSNPDTKVPGMDMASVPMVQKFLVSGGNATETSELDVGEGPSARRMLGAYSQVLSVNWGVIVQRKLSDAYHSVTEMRRQTWIWGLVAITLSLAVGAVAAKSITRPIDDLTQTARAIAQRDFSHHTFLSLVDLQTTSEKNRQLFFDSIEMIAAAVDAKDPYTKGHSGRVAQYSVILAKELGLSEEQTDKIRISATLHDVGKIGIEDRVLKKPGVLTNEEFELMKRHTVMGYEIVRQVKQLAEMLPGIRWHHEALNGKGYPDGISGDEIPLMTRIIAVADTFDAVTTDRPYQAGSDFPKALQILRKHAGSRYAPVVVDAMHASHSKGAFHKFETRRTPLVPVPQARS